ncbi:hypothetical protein J6590_028696, partial [Homalodisca vitripennis]
SGSSHSQRSVIIVIITGSSEPVTIASYCAPLAQSLRMRGHYACAAGECGRAQGSGPLSRAMGRNESSPVKQFVL